MITIGWCDPDDGALDRRPHTWHAYRIAGNLGDSLCKHWGWERGTDHAPLATPPAGAKVCKTCSKLAARKSP